MGMQRAAWLAVAAGAFVVAIPARAPACLWDSDTLRMEARGFPGIAEVLTGRFERNPPRYYEMRLEHVTRELGEFPDRLELYDDAGVACDRLGRSDEAIAWMEKKAAAIERLRGASGEHAALTEHEYRYHANIGTFHAHRWFKNGGDRGELGDLERAEAEIARAIEINPDAHFGREKYQLAAIRWVRELPQSGDPVNSIDQPTLVLRAEGMQPAPGEWRVDALKAEEAIRGLSGLVVLGNAWESVDVMWGLAVVLGAHEDASLKLVALMRVEELIASGKRSLHPSFDPERTEFHDVSAEGLPNRGMLYVGPQDEVERYFVRARRAADEWQQSRWTFMEARFAEGEHPDTHADFWDGWKDRPRAPSLPNTDPFFNATNFTILGAVLASPVALFLGLRRLRRRARVGRLVEID